MQIGEKSKMGKITMAFSHPPQLEKIWFRGIV
jgi:hypothetical protein